MKLAWGMKLRIAMPHLPNIPRVERVSQESLQIKEGLVTV